MYTVIVMDAQRTRIFAIDNIVEAAKTIAFNVVMRKLQEYQDRATEERISIVLDVFEWRDGQKDHLMMSMVGGPEQ